MITMAKGSLLAANADALVNTVNTVGVMGKGIALQFKNAFPGNFKAYATACKHNEVRPGLMFVHRTDAVQPGYIINFPTKRHWRGQSQIEYIRDGLIDLVRVIAAFDIQSIAIPPLGCGNGGLDWRDVEPLIREALASVPHVGVLLFAPEGAPDPETMPIGTAPPALTVPRAAILSLIGQYALPDYRLTAIEVQKLAYFLQVAGLPMRLNYEKAQFGPYAENLNHALQGLEGHYLRGYGDRSAEMAVHLLPDAGRQADDFLATQPEEAKSVASVAEVVQGYETPYGLELLATVHWAANDLGTAESSKIAHYVHDWNRRKEMIFSERHIEKALTHLGNHGLLPSP